MTVDICSGYKVSPFNILVYTTEGIYGTNESFFTDSNGITGKFYEWHNTHIEQKRLTTSELKLELDNLSKEELLNVWEYMTITLTDTIRKSQVLTL
jgi:hypothetical protein